MQKLIRTFAGAMKKEMDVIYRNIERLIAADAADNEREPIEPMTEWKWRRLYQIACKYGIGPWIADGITVYDDDFFLQLSPTLRQQFLDLHGDKDEQCMEKYELQLDRAIGPLHHLKPDSVKAYVQELITTIQNIEE